jgi:hypothetical protein
MGMATQVPGGNQTLNASPKLTFQNGAYTYSVETHNGKSQYTVSDGTQSIAVPIKWSVGAQAQTWVLERNGKLYESLVSYYPSKSGLALTTGDEIIKPRTLEEAFGRPISEEEAKSCFNCHATNAVVDHKLNLASMHPGLTCERCHAGADEHAAGILGGDMTSVPKKLGKISSEDMSNYCGQCHRTWETVVRSRWHGQADVRFQPYRLANSKCFDGTDARISCVACHNPHEKISRDSASYDVKCIACHAPVLKVASDVASTSAPRAKACQVAKNNCSSCHMPKVPLPNELMEFADHQIRIVKPGEPFPN